MENDLAKKLDIIPLEIFTFVQVCQKIRNNNNIVQSYKYCELSEFVVILWGLLNLLVLSFSRFYVVYVNVNII